MGWRLWVIVPLAREGRNLDPKLCNSPEVRKVLGFPWGKLSSEARLMRGTYRVAGSFLYPQFPSSVSPSGCHLPPGGRLKTHLLSSTRQRPSGARGTTGRTDAPVLFPLSAGTRPTTKKGTCAQGRTRDFSLGVWGGVSFPREKKCPPVTRTFDVQSLKV